MIHTAVNMTLYSGYYETYRGYYYEPYGGYLLHVLVICSIWWLYATCGSYMLHVTDMCTCGGYVHHVQLYAPYSRLYAHTAYCMALCTGYMTL